MKSKYLAIIFMFLAHLNTLSQQAVEQYIIKEQPNKVFTYNTAGYKGGGNFDPNKQFTMTFGSFEKTAGFDREINGVIVNKIQYNRAPRTNGSSFDYVRHQKHPKQAGNIINALFESTPTNGDVLYFTSSYANTLDEIINSYSVNRGSDNIFTNRVGTSSNIERLDLLNFNGIIVQDLNRQGFLINERNGNDNIQVAPILELDEKGNPSKYGPLIQVSTRSWGRTGPEITSRVVSRDTLNDKFFQPNVDIGPQTISGVFLTFEELFLKVGDTFFGFSIFPFDVKEGMDLIALTDVPDDTDGTVNGGADLLAGTGYFTNIPLSISGTILNDLNSRNDNKLTGRGLPILDGSEIYIHLVDKTLERVIEVVKVSKNGTFNFPGILSLREYSIYMSTVETPVGKRPGTTVLPRDWYITGENINSEKPEGYDEKIDGCLDLSLKESDVLRIDFGVAKASN